MGWLLSGGACRFTEGGLQVLELKGTSRLSLLSAHRGGFGIVSGFGPCVVHFPDLAPGGITVAVMVNDILHGREAAATLLNEVLAVYGYTAAWTMVPLSVVVDAGRLANSKGAEPLLKSLGGLESIKAAYESTQAVRPKDGSATADSSRSAERSGA